MDGLRAEQAGVSPATRKPFYRVLGPDGACLHVAYAADTPEGAIAAYGRRLAAEAAATPRPAAEVPADPPPAREAKPRRRAPRLFERVPDVERFTATDDPDGYLYHVTSATNAQSILAAGLLPGCRPTFSNYAGWSAGKAFLAERDGVSFWQWKVADHLANAFDRPPRVVVLRVPRDEVAHLLARDEPGEHDSRAGAWYVTEPIPQRRLPLAPDAPAPYAPAPR